MEIESRSRPARQVRTDIHIIKSGGDRRVWESVVGAAGGGGISV